MKIPIIFIKNGDDLIINNKNKPIFFEELKKELKKNYLFDLYDNSINVDKKKGENNMNKEINFFDEEEENNNIEYENYNDGNIIQIHIPTGKNINKIFKLIKEYLIINI